jgi:hypothetical protein
LVAGAEVRRCSRVVILRFEGGPMDGLEEESVDAPFLLFRTPPVGEIVRAVETADDAEEPPDFGATYVLAEVDRVAELARYRVTN